MVEQLPLLLRDSQKKVSLNVITSQPTLKDALKLRFIQLCQNIVPLIWLAYNCGYTLHPLKNELELE